VPLNPDLLGRSYPPVRYEVGVEKLREFATAVGETGALYHDSEAARAAGLPALPAVPTFAVVLSARAGQIVYDDPELGLDFSRVVHGEQSFEYDRPILAGDRLVATGRIAGIRSRGLHETLTVETVIETESGEPVCRTSSTIVIRGAAPAEAPSPVPTATGAAS
jgi:hypothetical protein